MKLTALIALSLLSVGLSACGVERKTEAQIRKAVAKDKIIALAEAMPASEPPKNPELAAEEKVAPPAPAAPPPRGRPTSPARKRNQARLYREPVEMYWNDWFGTLINNESDQADVAIVAEGKTSDFTGVISMNCENGLYFWLTASLWRENVMNREGYLTRADTVPEAVIAAVRYRYCPDQPPTKHG
jgi:hypothetical protein